jgi:intracellular septation protein A
MLDLLKAFRPVAVDLLSTILFVAFYAITGSILWATVLGIAAGIAQIGWLKWRGRGVAAMQWMSLGLVIVLGSITLFLNDPRFIMIKPSIATFAIGLVMLKPNWMGRYMPPIVTENLPASVPIAWGYVWAAAMFAIAGANLFVALTMSPAAWAWFNGTVPLVLQLSLFVIQYLSIRLMVHRALKAKAENPPGALLAD